MNPRPSSRWVCTEKRYPTRMARRSAWSLPWKYGFKSAKSIVKIRFVEKGAGDRLNRAAPSEYGFYSNVNPT